MRYYHVLRLGGSALLFMAILLWPIRYPLITKEENPDAGKVYLLSKDSPVTETILLPKGTTAGIVLWTNERPHIPATTPLGLIINGTNVVQKFKDTFNASSRSLRFNLPSTNYAQDTAVQLVLTAPTVNANQALPIRYQLKEEKKIAYQILSKKSLVNVLKMSFFNFNMKEEDIYYAYHEGGEVLAGKNPYICALDDTCLNHKNPTYFPLFYWLSAASQKLGLTSYDSWIALWKSIFLTFYLAIGALVFGIAYWRNKIALALFGSIFWLFNRWSLYVARVGQLDFLALFFVVVSVAFIQKWYWLSLFLLSISLSIKQVAIFIVPLYIVYALQTMHGSLQKKIQYLLLSTVLIASVPVITTLPFIFNNAHAVTTALFFSATRTSEADFGAAPIGTVLYLQGTAQIYCMLFLIALIAVAMWRYKLPLATAVVLTFITFLAFNTVLFNQYFLWMIPFVPLVASEWPTRSL